MMNSENTQLVTIELVIGSPKTSVSKYGPGDTGAPSPAAKASGANPVNPPTINNLFMFTIDPARSQNSVVATEAQ